ncbi:MAG: hypothetical protein QXQ94_08820 [Candidatus Bathyarchaeia archaeon]
MVEALETVKQKLLESLSFAGVTKEEIDSLVKIGEPMTCSYLNVHWRKEPYWVILKINLLEYDEDFKNKRKLITVKVQTKKQSMHERLKHTESECQEFKAELGPPLL